MSLYIKGMEMPTRCWDCLLNTYGYCMASEHSDIIPSDAPIPEWCPLIPVPPHGDLIDRDKLEKDIDKYIGGEESRSRFHHWVQVQRSVILKSEEEQT